MGFIKWLYAQYKVYKLEKALKRTNAENHVLFMRNFKRCIEVGFSEQQIMALMNLLSSK